MEFGGDGELGGAVAGSLPGRSDTWSRKTSSRALSPLSRVTPARTTWVVSVTFCRAASFSTWANSPVYWRAARPASSSPAAARVRAVSVGV
ncbi:hypothetical protein ACFQ60_40220 [Streptomyces zhihengii]